MDKIGTKYENGRVVHQYIDTENARYGRKACSDRITTAVNKANMHRQIKKVIFNNPATIVIWADNIKTIVKCDGEKFDPEKGLAMAIVKRLLGDNNGYYYEVFDKWLPKKEENVEKKK